MTLATDALAPLTPLLRFAAAVPSAIVDRALVERAAEPLHTFLRVCWPQVEPGKPFIDGKALHVMCEHAEAVSKGEIKRIVVNVPPGFTKSLTWCVFWPCWEWLSKPENGWLFGSYDPQLTHRDSRKAYNLLSSPWFIERFGRLLPTEKQPVGSFRTRANGERFATSVKGKATGRHFRRHVADDPIKPRDATGGASFSEATLEEVAVWWNETISSRTDSYEQLARVVVMQRLHTGDLSQRCIDRGDYQLLRIPMRYDPVVAVPNVDWRTELGESAWPERFPEAAIKIAEGELGTAAAVSSQHQQTPTPKGGLIFREHTFRYWHTDGAKIVHDGVPCYDKPLPAAGIWFQSWDMTFKDLETSDFVCGGAWQGVKNKVYLHGFFKQRAGLPASANAMRAMSSDYPKTFRKLIEDKANGPAVEQVLRGELPGITMVEPQGTKSERAESCQPMFERGQVVFPHPSMPGYEWVTDVVKILTKFPFVAHDDDVDMITQAVLDYFLRQNKLALLDSVTI